MTRTWTEEEYEAVGLRSIHLRLTEKAYNDLIRLSERSGEGRAKVIERLIAKEISR